MSSSEFKTMRFLPAS